MVRLEDTEKRHNTHMVIFFLPGWMYCPCLPPPAPRSKCAGHTHMVRTIRVCPYRTRMVRKIIPYAYGMYHTRMVCTIRVWYKIRIWYRTYALRITHNIIIFICNYQVFIVAIAIYHCYLMNQLLL